MIIGDELSSVTLKLHDHLGQFGIPIISSGSSSHWLDNVHRYPELLRSKLSNKRAVPIALEACRNLNVTSLVLLYSNTPYGKSAAEIFTDHAENYTVCVQETIILKENSTMIQNVGQRLATDIFVPRVFLLFAEDHITKLFTSGMHNIGSSRASATFQIWRTCQHRFLFHFQRSARLWVVLPSYTTLVGAVAVFMNTQRTV